MSTLVAELLNQQDQLYNRLTFSFNQNVSSQKAKLVSFAVSCLFTHQQFFSQKLIWLMHRSNITHKCLCLCCLSRQKIATTFFAKYHQPLVVTRSLIQAIICKDIC